MPANTLASQFSLGRVVATPAALSALQLAGIDPGAVIARHHNCDWTELSENDMQCNVAALDGSDRIFSHFTYANGVKIYVITEWDRSVTTLLLPEEY